MIIPNSIRAVWGGSDSRPPTTGQRLTPTNFTRDVSPDVNVGGAEQVGTRMGLVDGTVVMIMQPTNPIFSPEGTREWIKVREWRAGGAVKSIDNNLIPPGTGTISSNGLSLLKEYEDLGSGNMIYNEAGELIAIRSVDVEGDGNITYGFGVLFRSQDSERLMRDYGVQFGVGVEVSVEVATRMMQDWMENNLSGLHNFTRSNEIWLTQDQFDALIIHYYMRPRAIINSSSGVNILLREIFSEPNSANNPNIESLYRDRLYNSMIDDLRVLARWNDFGRGWTNRVLDTLELFFEGDAMRNH